MVTQVMDTALGKRANAARRVHRGGRSTGHSHPSTGEMNYTRRELEFMNAMQEFKRVSGKQFPTWSEALRVIDALGYVRTMPTTDVAFKIARVIEGPMASQAA